MFYDQDIKSIDQVTRILKGYGYDDKQIKTGLEKHVEKLEIESGRKWGIQ